MCGVEEKPMMTELGAELENFTKDEPKSGNKFLMIDACKFALQKW